MDKPHTSRDFEAELESLRARIRGMAERCTKTLDLALEAFWAGSQADYDVVASLDRQIDEDEREIDAFIVRMIALRQPVAHDLRVLSASFKLTTDLQRIGSEARHIAEHAGEAMGAAKESVRAELEGICELARAVLRDAIEGFVSADEALSRSVIERDKRIDAGYASIVSAMIEHIRAHAADATAAVRIIKVARYLERVGDHAKNIAEESIFAISGIDVRHVAGVRA